MKKGTSYFFGGIIYDVPFSPAWILYAAWVVQRKKDRDLWLRDNLREGEETMEVEYVTTMDD